MAALGERDYGPVRSLLPSFLHPQEEPSEWGRRREQIREAVWKALSVSPVPPSVPFDAEVVSEEQVPPQAWPSGISGEYRRLKVNFQVRPGERMNVWVLVPPGIGPFPAMVASHQTVQEGKDEPVGLGGYHWMMNFGPFLANRGLVVIAPGSPTAGERYNPLTGPVYETSRSVAEDPTWSLLGARLRDHLRVVDFLQSLPYVEGGRIGVIGHSLGGESAALLIATLAQRSPGGAVRAGVAETLSFPGSGRSLLRALNFCVFR